MWNRINPASNLSIATTVNEPKTPRSWNYFRSRTGLPSKQADESESPTFEYSPTIPDAKLPEPVPPNTRADFLLITRIVLQHVCILLAAIAPIALLGITAFTPTWWNSISYSHSLSFSHCNYDGSFTPYNHRTLSLWSPSSFFRINLFWGHMTFSLAKFLDVGFDLVVGRGIQAVLAILTYKVASKVLGKLMEGSTVSYQTFEALAFVSPSLARTTNLTIELLTNKGLQARATIMMLVLSSLFVLMFPTLTNAMSGYSHNWTARFQDRDGRNVSWSDVRVVQFFIHDAQQLGADGPLPVSASPSCLFMGPGMTANGNSSGLIYRREDSEGGEGEEDDDDNLWAAVPPSCSSFWRTVQYVSEHGVNTSIQTDSEFYLGESDIDLEPPTLNITTSYDFKSLRTLTNVLNNSLNNIPTSSSTLKSVSGAAIRPNTTFILNNQTYDFEYVMTHAFCQPANTHYWGFSFLFLFITVLSLAVWAIIMYVLWLDTYLHSRIDREARSMGMYRGSWDLVQAMKQDSSVETITDTMSEDDIRKLISRRRRKGMPFDSGGLTYLDLYPDHRRTRWRDFKAWWRGSHDINYLRTSRLSGKSRYKSEQASSPVSGGTVWSASTRATMTAERQNEVLEFRNDLGHDSRRVV